MSIDPNRKKLAMEGNIDFTYVDEDSVFVTATFTIGETQFADFRFLVTDVQLKPMKRYEEFGTITNLLELFTKAAGRLKFMADGMKEGGSGED